VDGGSITQVLARVNAGDESARSKLWSLVYDDLRALASDCFRRHDPTHTLQPTALAHEAYLRLVNPGDGNWKDRAHFLAVAAKAMRQILINYAHSKSAQKRGGGEWRRITLDEALDAVESKTVDVLALDETLTRLAALSERQAHVVELRVFGGLTIEETGHVLNVGPTTVKSDWLVARAWLRHELRKERVA